MYRTQRWLATAPAAEVAIVIGAHFPEIDRAMRERIVARFAKQDTWARDPLLRRAGYDYLQQILQTGGFITKSHRYEDLVDTEIARRAMSETAG